MQIHKKVCGDGGWWLPGILVLSLDLSQAEEKNWLGFFAVISPRIIFILCMLWQKIMTENSFHFSDLKQPVMMKNESDSGPRFSWWRSG